MSTTNDYDPLGSLWGVYGIHALLMVWAYGVLGWLGVGFARTSQRTQHIRVQVTLVIIACVGFFLAIGSRTAGYIVVRDSNHNTINVERPRMGAHGIGGICVFAITLAQASFGTGIRCERQHSIRRTFHRVHTIVGYVLMAAASLQMTLGLAAAFSLCSADNGGTVECGSAFGWAAALGGGAFLQHTLSSLCRTGGDALEWLNIVVGIGEPAYVAIVAIMGAFAERAFGGDDDGLARPNRPLTVVTMIVAALITSVAAAGGVVWRQRRVALGRASRRGFVYVPLLVLAPIALYVDANRHNAYARFAAIYQSVAVIIVIVARVGKRYRLAAAGLTTLAISAAARQRGFERLFTLYAGGEHAAEHAPIGYAATAVVSMTLVVHVAVDYWMHAFGYGKRHVAPASSSSDDRGLSTNDELDGDELSERVQAFIDTEA